MTTSSRLGRTVLQYHAAFNATNRYALGSLPLELAPGVNLSLDRKISAASQLAASGTIRDLLTNHGAIHFKGLGLKDPEEFSRFARSFGWSPHEDIGNPVRRTVLAFNVATALEAPHTVPVYPHNEYGLSPHYPAYVFFYCFSAPESGLSISWLSKIREVPNKTTRWGDPHQQLYSIIRETASTGSRLHQSCGREGKE